MTTTRTKKKKVIAATGPKKLFISDIHMGDARSFEGPHPYGWFRKNIPNLATFLTEQLNAPEVAEVVILGDLFDDWVIPTTIDPLRSFQAICDNPTNSPVIEGMKKLAARGILTYVPGNHDMALSTADIAETQKFVETTFPGIHYCSDPNLPHGVYRSGKLVAEHGNRYALFNASDTWTDPPSFLPLGYFISRLVAYKVSKTGTKECYWDILRKFILQFMDRPNFIYDLLIGVAGDAKLKKTDPINMKGIGGFPFNVEGIGSLYEYLLKNWAKKRKDTDWLTAVWGDLGDLSPAANLIYFFPGRKEDQNIVIFGHTHEADMRKHYFMEEAPSVDDIHCDLPCRAIYANSGAWVDSARYCTYVETQEDAAARRHYVRLLTYPSKTLLQEAFVKL